MRDQSPETCPNCGEVVVGSFCGSCGQSQRDVRRSLFWLLREAAEELLSLDAKLPKTLWLLFRRPGFLTAEWIRGRRVRYLPPLRIYLIASVVFFTATFLVGFPGIGGPRGWMFWITASPEFEAAIKAFRGEVQRLVTLAVVVIVPALMILLKILHLRRRCFFVDHLVFALHFVSFVFLFWSFLWPFLVIGTSGWVAVLSLLMGLIPLLYLFRALRTVHGQGKILAVTKTLLVPVALFLALLTMGRSAAQAFAYQAGGTFGRYERALMNETGDRFRAWVAARNSGDEAQAAELLPQALRFVREASRRGLRDQEPLHLVELLLAAGDSAGARAHALQALEGSPGEVWALGVVALTSPSSEDPSLVSARFHEFTDAYAAMDSTRASALADHAPLLEAISAKAEEMVGGEAPVREGRGRP